MSKVETITEFARFRNEVIHFAEWLQESDIIESAKLNTAISIISHRATDSLMESLTTLEKFIALPEISPLFDKFLEEEGGDA
jgi:hypothetical protein